MFENLKNIFKKNKRKELLKSSSKDKAKERLHLVLMQDRANVSADFLDLMRREIIEVIKKYIDIDEEAMDVRLTTETNEDGVQTAPALYANIPIINIKDETRKLSKTNQENKIQIEPPKEKEEKKVDKEEKDKKEEKVIEEESKKQSQENENPKNQTEEKTEEKNEEKIEEKTEEKQEDEKPSEENTLPPKENIVNEEKEESKEKIEEENKNEE